MMIMYTNKLFEAFSKNPDVSLDEFVKIYFEQTKESIGFGQYLVLLGLKEYARINDLSLEKAANKFHPTYASTFVQNTPIASGCGGCKKANVL